MDAPVPRVGDRLDRFAMLIVCPSCASEYTLDPDRIQARGRKVRCAVCRGTWTVRRPSLPRADTSARDLSESASGSQQTIDAVPDGYPPPGQGGAFPPQTADRGLHGVRSRMPGRLALAAILLVLVATPSAIALRQQLVAEVPPTATLFEAVGLPVNLVGLELADVTAFVEQDGASRALIIEGEIRSASRRPVTVPRLEFAIDDPNGAGLYRWSAKPPVGELGPGESARFSARLASPPPDGARLVASFQTGPADQSVALR